MALILLLQTLFGNVFAVRTIQFFRERALLHDQTLTKIGIAYICLQSWWSAVDSFSNSVWHISPLIVFACLPLLLWILEARSLEKMRTELPIFIDRWLLNVRTGLGAQRARENALSFQSERFQILLSALFSTANSGTAGRHHILLHPTIQTELKNAQVEPHLALKRLELIREMIRKSDSFRRKSGRAVRQTFTQAVVMLCLNLALTVFVVRHYGWNAMSDLVLMAGLFTTLGILMMLKLARKRKWNI